MSSAFYILNVISALTVAVTCTSVLAEGADELSNLNSQEEFILPVFGRISSRDDVVLSARRSGVILIPDLDERTTISEGEILFELDCEVERSQREIYIAALRQAELEYQSRERLQEYSAATELEVSLAQSAVDRAAAELQVYENVLERCAQIAPFNGQIIEQFIQNQEYAREGDPVLRFVDPSNLRIEFLAPATWVSLLAEGDLIYILFEGREDQTEIVVTRISPVIDAVGQTFAVHATQVGETDHWMRVGMVGLISLTRE